MEKRKKTAFTWLCIALLMMLIGLIGASIVQSNWGRIAVKTVEFVDRNGLNLKGTLFVPPNAKEAPAPAIVVAHGMYADSGMTDVNFVELARRGYVVLIYDSPSHGESDNVPNVGLITTAGYDAVTFLAGLPYVDAAQIGITGHSLGGAITSAAVAQDIEYGTNYIKSALVNSTAPTVADRVTREYYNAYGNVNVAVMAGLIDEYGFRFADKNGNPTLPKNYIDSHDAQFFLNFSEEPDWDHPREANTLYSQTVAGKESRRALYTAYSWHTLTFYNTKATAHIIDWFEQTIGAPHPISSGNQIWPLKMLFNLISLVGLFIFICAFATTMLFTPFFSSLRTREIVQPRESLPGDKKWFWLLLLLCPLFGIGVFLPLMNNLKARTWSKDPWSQADSWGLGAWTMVIALFTLALMFVIYYVQWRKQGVRLRDRGLAISVVNLGKTILLAVVTVASVYLCVYIGKFFFHTDFRFYEMIRIVPFKSYKLSVILWPYLPLFVTGYVASSIANNSFNYKVSGKDGKGRWQNLTLCAVMSALPALLLYVPSYVWLFITGDKLFPNGDDFMYISWLISTLAVMPISTVIGRRLYQLTNNPYLGGIIFGIMMTMIKCMSTLTWS